MFCYKCGSKLSKDDKYCLKCGTKVFNAGEMEILQCKTDEINTKQSKDRKPSNAASDENKKAAAALPNKKKTKAEAFMQFMTILFALFALVIVTIVGAMLISGHSAKNELSDDGDVFDDKGSVYVSDDVSSQDSTASSQSTTASTETQVTQTTTKAKTDDGLIVPDTAEFRKKIVGTWKTDLAYKSMTVPATIVFGSNGKCSVSVKAMFITKKFEGTYTVGDGGKCVMKLSGIEEFMQGKSTISGKAAFYNDNKARFVIDGGDELILQRV